MAAEENNYPIETIRAQADAIVASGVLGRSRFYRALLEYLVESAATGRAPKEIEIAAEVFDRGNGFDPTQDSMVRVYAHNLRQKLDQYYKDVGRDVPAQLTIPKGEYRIVLAPPDGTAARTPGEPVHAAGGARFARAGLGALLVLAGVFLGIGVARLTATDVGALAAGYREVAASPFWAGMLDDDQPVMIVVGDYFIFGEGDGDGDVDRLVREFSINSSRDLAELTRLDPDLAGRYVDLNLTYLPSSTASALRDFLRVLYTTDKPVSVISMSSLDAMDIRDNHIIYVGYLSALDKLFDFVFSGSELAIGSTFDELVDTITGTTFRSEAGMPTEQRNYRDYGLVSVFPGPNGNQFMILAGTRDEGLMQSAQAVSDPAAVAAGLERIGAATADAAVPAFEILYEVAGFGRTNMDARIVHVAPLDRGAMRTGELSSVP